MSTAAANKDLLDHQAHQETQDRMENRVMTERQETMEPMRVPTISNNRCQANVNAFPDQVNVGLQVRWENLAKTANLVKMVNQASLAQMEDSQASRDPQVHQDQKGHAENLEY